MITHGCQDDSVCVCVLLVIYPVKCQSAQRGWACASVCDPLTAKDEEESEFVISSALSLSC